MLVIRKEKKISKSCSATFLFIDDVLSLNKSQFDDYLDCIYHYGQKVDTINIARSANFDGHV